MILDMELAPDISTLDVDAKDAAKLVSIVGIYGGLGKDLSGKYMTLIHRNIDNM